MFCIVDNVTWFHSVISYGLNGDAQMHSLRILFNRMQMTLGEEGNCRQRRAGEEARSQMRSQVSVCC